MLYVFQYYRDKMVKVYLLRHAESEFQVNFPDDTVYDVPLSEKGHEQASQVQGHFELALCSPLMRARQTLESSKITYDKMEIIQEARERKTFKGDFFEGENFQNVELLPEFVLRVKKLIEILKGRCEKYQKVVLVCHWWIGKILTSTDHEEIIQGSSEGNGIILKNCEMISVEL